jgi:hypothetical protein
MTYGVHDETRKRVDPDSSDEQAPRLGGYSDRRSSLAGHKDRNLWFTSRKAIRVSALSAHDVGWE